MNAPIASLFLVPLLAAPPAQNPPKEQPAHHGHAEAGNGHHGNPADMDEYIKRLEDPSRDEWQKPEAVVTALGLKPGQVACDVGAGPGYFTLRMARKVGNGHVFGLDVEPAMVDLLRNRAAKAGVTNLTPVLAAYDNPLLPASSCDVVLVVDTYHHFENGPAYLLQLKRILRPGGMLVNIDFHKRETPMGPPMEMRISREAFLKDAESAGFKLAREETFLPHQYMLVLTLR